jgi:hypothetical protein
MVYGLKTEEVNIIIIIIIIIIIGKNIKNMGDVGPFFWTDGLFVFETYVACFYISRNM